MFHLPIDGEVEPLMNLNIPLWCVYGFASAPTIICCKLLKNPENPHNLKAVCIWGYSLHNGVPAYRTIGTTLAAWRGRNAKSDQPPEHWFLDKTKALAYVNFLITPTI